MDDIVAEITSQSSCESHTEESDAETHTETSNSSRKILLRQFIELYETLPELWDPTNPLYMKKNKRNLALDKLLVIFNKMKPNATRDDVRKKINTLRSNYRKELKKMLALKRSGSGTEDIYEPSSWVFYALQFLKKIEAPVSLNMPGNLQEVSIYFVHI